MSLSTYDILCLIIQVEVMKSNVESRIKAYEQQLEKFAARWNQLKPGDDTLEGDQKKCLEAIKSIRERKEEFEEVDSQRAALV